MIKRYINTYYYIIIISFHLSNSYQNSSIRRGAVIDSPLPVRIKRFFFSRDSRYYIHGDVSSDKVHHIMLSGRDNPLEEIECELFRTP